MILLIFLCLWLPNLAFFIFLEYYRKHEDWYVFVVENKLTKLCAVKIDHITDFEAEVISGLKQNQLVITHPSNQVVEGILVTTSESK